MLARETVILGGLCTADLILTVYLIQVHGWDEGNPLMAAVLTWGIGAFVAVKLLSFVPALALAEWYRRRRPGPMERLMRRVAVAYALIYALGFLTANAPALREALCGTPDTWYPPIHRPEGGARHPSRAGTPGRFATQPAQRKQPAPSGPARTAGCFRARSPRRLQPRPTPAGGPRGHPPRADSLARNAG